MSDDIQYRFALDVLFPEVYYTIITHSTLHWKGFFLQMYVEALRMKGMSYEFGCKELINFNDHYCTKSILSE